MRKDDKPLTTEQVHDLFHQASELLGGKVVETQDVELLLASARCDLERYQRALLILTEKRE
ncbi:hypothetical protein MXMO3_01822 [Maritalea myrionectae]|uniref:Uncharacterized protein n=1 Tax=Maritalea myrionectae TaxID=454601 RepID=A0A2R4ME80_9HYPH|nr:hypothetical protein [Maritalea myrionectae]AVX04347.1 hypothetical protein MXMO3_01822 [Maritalea myrionectae]